MKNKPRQILRVNYSTPPQSFHPHLVSDIRTQTICKALYEGLTRVTLEDTIELAIAKKVKMSPCKKKYTFILRDCKWSNGKQVTADHFVNAWRVAIHPKCIYAKRFFPIKNAKQAYNREISSEKIGVYSLSSDQLVVELEHPAPYFLQLVADPVYSPVYDLDLYKEPTTFNGPFTLKNYDPVKQITLHANPLYWDAEGVSLKKIKITLIEDMETAFSMYKKGDSDWLGSPFTNLSDEVIQAYPETRSDHTPFWVFCNTESSKLRSIYIRKALHYAIDRDQIIKQAIPYQEALFNILPGDLSSFLESPFEKPDIEKAIPFFKQGLKEIGMSAQNFELTLSHSDMPDQEKIALCLKHQWEKTLGIKVSLRKSEWNTFYSKIKSGDYEIGGLFICNLYDDPSYLMKSFESSYTNYAGWEHPDYQKYFSLAEQCHDEDQRTHYLQRAEKILMDEMPVIPIYNHAHLYVCNDNLVDFPAPKFNYADFKWAYFEEDF